jgi:hypothetical protein
MDYCAPRGIAHSDFLEWDEDSRIGALAWMVEDRITCSQCGTREEEWDPSQGGDRVAYVPVAHTCQGCARIEQAYEDSHAEARRNKTKYYGRRFRLMPGVAYAEMMKAKRDDPKYRERQKDRLGISGYNERRKKRREARDAKRAEDNAPIPKGMIEEDPSS